MPSASIALAVVSDNPVVHQGLLSVLTFSVDDLGFDIEIVPTGQEDVADVVLYDLMGLYESDGSDLQRLVKAHGAVVVGVAIDARQDLTTRALDLGAAGFVSLGASSDELNRVVRSAAAGLLGDEPAHGAQALHLGETAGLTEREALVVGLIAQGFSNVEIAETAYISINTVKTYIRSAYRKIGVASRSQAVGWALQHGFAPPAAPAGG